MTLFTGSVPGGETLTVGELARLLRQTLDGAFPEGVWVTGEIDSITRARSGHVYFDLVERSDAAGAAPTAVMSVVLFRDDRQRVNRIVKRFGNAVRMENGVQVRIQAMVDFYAPRGQLQLRMTSIDPAYTLGAIAAYRAAVLARLAEEGLLRRNAELALPAVPLRVGLVTSLGSAAHADILKVLSSSGYAFEVTEVDTAVQGPEAPGAIAAAVAAAAAHGEVVVLARGGGSTSDLAAFDHELVARAVASCPRPVLTGIGHETDHSAADEVAHTACSTPTASARAVVRRVEDWLSRLDETAMSVVHRSRRAVEAAALRTDRAASDTARAGRAAVERPAITLASSVRRLNHAGRTAEQRARRQLDQASARFTLACRLDVRGAAGRLDVMEARVRALDPTLVLRRGWSLTRRADGRLVRSVDDVAVGEDITTHLADGVLTSTIHTRRSGEENGTA